MSLKVLYFGTSDFAARILRGLAAFCEIVGVVTRIDSRKGRGMQLFPSEVATVAEELGVKQILKPKSLKTAEILQSVKALEVDCVVVASYGLIIPTALLDLCPYFINVHASLLPEYRGAAPIERSIMDGKNETGISLMKMEEGLDTGGYWVQGRFPINDDTKSQDLSVGLADLAVQLLSSNLYRIVNNELPLIKQGDKFTYAAKIRKGEELIDWHQNASQIVRQINAISGVGYIGDIKIKLLDAKSVSNPNLDKIGMMNNGIVQCGAGGLKIETLQPAGKKAMSIKAFLNGFKGDPVWKIVDNT